VVVTGQTVTFTEEGTNPCGAANLNYGDGVVITYAITGLPAQQTHVFEKAGTYTVIARGMGNCDGETTTTVQVKPAAVPPPAPPPTGPHISALEFAPSPGAARQPVTIIVNGEGSCRFTTTFGDGNSRELNVQLPTRFDHTYALPGTYTVIAAPVAPCSGKFTERLTVVPRNAPPRLFDLTIEPSPTEAGTPVTITVRGTGACSYAIDFGDGNNDSRTATLPDRLRHNYPAGGEYDVTATAIPPCTGSVRRTVQVRVR
jgi:PKD repeat protein